MLMAGTSLPLLFNVTGCSEEYECVTIGLSIPPMPIHETQENYGIVPRPINQKYYDTVYKLLMNHFEHSLRREEKEVVVELAIDRNGSVLNSKVIRCDNENDRRVWSDALFGFDTVPKPPQPILYRWKLRFPLTNE